jgi:hypothetical protein
MRYIQFTCFTSTQVRILTQETSLQVPVRHDTRACEVLSRLRQVLSLGLNCTKVPAPLLVHKVQVPTPDALRAKSVLRQYVYFCTSKASKLSTCGRWHLCGAAAKSVLRQYLYFCTSKASKLSTCGRWHLCGAAVKSVLRQYLYFCTSKASKLSTCGRWHLCGAAVKSVLRQCLYFCTSKASKLSTCGRWHLCGAAVKSVSWLSTRIGTHFTCFT